MKCNACKCNFALLNCKYDFTKKAIVEITLMCNCKRNTMDLTKKDIDDRRWEELVTECYAVMCL